MIEKQVLITISKDFFCESFRGSELHFSMTHGRRGYFSDGAFNFNVGASILISGFRKIVGWVAHSPMPSIMGNPVNIQI